MKKFIFLFGIILFSVAAFGQRGFDQSTLTVPAGTVDTSATKNFSGHTWSSEFNANDLDGIDTLWVYATANEDTANYAPIWVDRDLDGVNDNPWLLPQPNGKHLLIWGDSWPSRFIIYELHKGTSTAGKKVYIDETKQ